MSALRRLAVLSLSAAVLLGPEAIPAPVRGGEPSPEYRAILKSTLAKRKQRYRVGLARQRAMLSVGAPIDLYFEAQWRNQRQNEHRAGCGCQDCRGREARNPDGAM
jgi:hypothetical protein